MQYFKKIQNTFDSTWWFSYRNGTVLDLHEWLGLLTFTDIHLISV